MTDDSKTLASAADQEQTEAPADEQAATEGQELTEAPAEAQELTDEQAEALRDAAQRLKEFDPRKLEEAVIQLNINAENMARRMTGYAKAIIDNWAQTFQFFLDELEELEPYIEAELEKPEYAGLSAADIYRSNEDGKKLFEDILKAARAARDAEIAAAPTATAKKAHSVEYPLDKPNSHIWDLLQKDTKGQIEFNLAQTGSKQVVPAYYSINFDGLSDELKITKMLQPFDKRVYIAVSALFNAGNTVITLRQIYQTMGYKGTAGTSDLEKIDEAITKMTTARIYFDNEQEAKKYKYNHFKYDGSLLPIERGRAIVNGQLADAAIHIFREPPLITFAKQRGQVTTIDIKLLQSPISKTEANLRIDDYLIERISREKRKRRNARKCRILYKTLFERTKITTTKQVQRAPAKIQKYLTYYQQQGFITRFDMDADGITIYW